MAGLENSENSTWSTLKK